MVDHCVHHTASFHGHVAHPHMRILDYEHPRMAYTPRRSRWLRQVSASQPVRPTAGTGTDPGRAAALCIGERMKEVSIAVVRRQRRLRTTFIFLFYPELA